MTEGEEAERQLSALAPSSWILPHYYLQRPLTRHHHPPPLQCAVKPGSTTTYIWKATEAGTFL